MSLMDEVKTAQSAKLNADAKLALVNAALTLFASGLLTGPGELEAWLNDHGVIDGKLNQEWLNKRIKAVFANKAAENIFKIIGEKE